VRRQVFVPNWGRGSVAFYVRTATPSAGAFSMARNEVKQLDSSMPIYEMKTLKGNWTRRCSPTGSSRSSRRGFGLLARSSRRLVSTA